MSKLIIKSFAEFVSESTSWSEKFELMRMGIDTESGFKVLKIRIDWDNLDQKSIDGSPLPYMKCWYYEDWPNSTDDDDSWVEYPSKELVRLYKEGLPGDNELVFGEILEIAKDHGVDLIWELTDGEWFDAKTGENLGQLNKLL